MVTCLVCGEALTVVGASRVHPTCEVDADAAAMDVITVIREGVLYQPRSMQTRIGPSEMGHPCSRRIGHKLAGTPASNDRGVAWKPFIGTAAHAAVADYFARNEVARWEDGSITHPRWYVEEQVTVGDILGEAITGNADLFDGSYGIVWDHKFTTRRMIRDYKSGGPGDQYRTQAHLYGRGFANAGHDVRWVGICFWTRDGEFTDRYFWHEPYDEQVALNALQRVTNIKAALVAHGSEVVLPLLPMVESYCQHCPYFRRGEDDLVKACPGTKPVSDDPVEEMFA